MISQIKVFGHDFAFLLARNLLHKNSCVDILFNNFLQFFWFIGGGKLMRCIKQMHLEIDELIVC